MEKKCLSRPWSILDFVVFFLFLEQSLPFVIFNETLVSVTFVSKIGFNLIGHFDSLVRHAIIIYEADLNNISNVLKGLEEAFSDKEVTISQYLYQWQL